MTRTERIPLRDRVLPDYTRSEEIMNMVTHIIGGAVGLLILIGSVLIGAKHRDPWAITSGSIYGRNPGLPREEHRGFPAPPPLSPFSPPDLTGGSTPLLCLEGVPDLPVAPQDEAGLTKTFQTWPRVWFHIP